MAMNINDAIATTYLNNRDVNSYSDRWYYSETETAKFTGGNIFTSPNSDKETQEKVKVIYDVIHTAVKTFQPTNVRIWDLLFPDWRKVLEDVDVDLIVGFPEPYDATVEYDKQGRCHVIFDLVCWTKYIGKCEINDVVRGLLTHELSHVLLHNQVPGLTNIEGNTDYLRNLDTATFDEGFAHLLSYDTKEIDAVDWHSEKLLTVFDRSREKMTEALDERNPDRQSRFLYEAVCGNYYDKFACMCGMLYLANQWMTGGDIILKDIMEEGFEGFARKAASIPSFVNRRS
ncbi:MAG: hypothetical protein LUH19_05855 [Lachnospiraceae bacterium]|nr:hypothetical protein [Lachnospiraceae bacterium]